METVKKAVVVALDSVEFNQYNDQCAGRLKWAWDMAVGDKDSTKTLCVRERDVSGKNCIVVIKTDDLKTLHDWRLRGGEAMKCVKGKVDTLSFEIKADKDDLEALKEGAVLAGYTFNKYKSETDTQTRVEDIDSLSTIHNSVILARDLINEPGNVLYPATYAERIAKAFSGTGAKVTILSQSRLKEMGMNLLLSVGEGSDKDSCVVVIEYMKGAEGDAPIALVGKGVTFDTGGISLKPSQSMHEMKTDMGGSAAVLGAMHAAVRANLPVNLVCLIGAVENMPGSRATRPGDVVTGYGGISVENHNTDAEGRLVLCDLIAYAQKDFGAKTIIDAATLTGACVVALGSHYAGLFSNSTSLSKTIVKSGKVAGESYWRLPMGPEYKEQIKSDIADIKNVGGREAGAITAAEYLKCFVKDGVAWAHLDIAGTAYQSKSPNSITPKGAVGFGVRTLFELIKAEGNATYAEDEADV